MESQTLQYKKVGHPISLIVKSGDKFGMLKVITEKLGGKERTADFLCECGNTVNLPIKVVLSGNTKSCGCLRKKIGAHNRASLVGKRFGRLVVIKRLGTSGPDRAKRTVWECKCDCGKVTFPNTNELRMGHTKSCGCLKLDLSIGRMTTHGFKSVVSTKEQRVFYKKWENINNRCFNPKTKDYKYYGGRGIKVEWENFKEFKQDMWLSFCRHLITHTLKETTIDRKNNNGNYCKKNCRWVNQSVQVSNRRNLRLTKTK